MKMKDCLVLTRTFARSCSTVIGHRRNRTRAVWVGAFGIAFVTVIWQSNLFKKRIIKNKNVWKPLQSGSLFLMLLYIAPPPPPCLSSAVCTVHILQTYFKCHKSSNEDLHVNWNCRGNRSENNVCNVCRAISGRGHRIFFFFWGGGGEVKYQNYCRLIKFDDWGV